MDFSLSGMSLLVLMVAAALWGVSAAGAKELNDLSLMLRSQILLTKEIVSGRRHCWKRVIAATKVETLNS